MECERIFWANSVNKYTIIKNMEINIKFKPYKKKGGDGFICYLCFLCITHMSKNGLLFQGKITIGLT